MTVHARRDAARGIRNGFLLGGIAAAISGLFLCPASAASRLVIGEGVGHPVPPDLFGQFLERPSWSGERGPESVCDAEGRLPRGVEDALAAMRAPVVRFPAGTDADFMDWRDMADLPGRPARPLSVGSAGDTVTNRFGYPEYFDLARRMGWRTILVANLRDALYLKKPRTEAEQNAAELLSYGLRLAAPGALAALQIGNESWAYWPPRRDQAPDPGHLDPAGAALHLRACLIAQADAVRRVSRRVPLICDAPRAADFITPGSVEDHVWRIALDHPDIRSRFALLAAHAYAPLDYSAISDRGRKLDPATLTDDQVWYGALAALGRFDAGGQCMADGPTYDLINHMGFRAAVTEWNWNGWGWDEVFPQVPFRDGLPAALGAAAFLHGLMRHPGVALATQSLLLGTSWGITSVRVLPDGSVTHGPQGEAVRLYAQLHGAEFLPSRLADVPSIPLPVALSSWPQAERLSLVDAVVTAGSGRLFVHLINRSRTETMRLGIVLPDGYRVNGTAWLTSLTGDPATLTTRGGGRMSRAEAAASLSGAGGTVVLPPASISVLEIPVGELFRTPEKRAQQMP